jgi:hypothetical protein
MHALTIYTSVITMITHPAKQAGHHVDTLLAYRITQPVFAIVAVILLDRRTTCPPPPSTLIRLQGVERLQHPAAPMSRRASSPLCICNALFSLFHTDHLSGDRGNEMRRANGSSVTRLS